MVEELKKQNAQMVPLNHCNSNELMRRCYLAEESLRQETSNSEKMRMEITILKQGLENGLKAFGI